MTAPQKPGEAITLAAQRLQQQRKAAKALSQTIADERTAQGEPTPQEQPGGTP